MCRRFLFTFMGHLCFPRGVARLDKKKSTPDVNVVAISNCPAFTYGLFSCDHSFNVTRQRRINMHQSADIKDSSQHLYRPPEC